MSTKFCCPRCGSENVQSLPIIYQSGSAGNDAITQTGQIISVTKGQTMTNLARSVAPPSKKPTSWWMVFCLAGVAGTFILGDGLPAWVGIIAAAVSAGLWQENSKIDDYNKNIFPAEYEAWEKSFLCHRCGNIFRL